jgi:beta-glucosidase
MCAYNAVDGIPGLRQRRADGGSPARDLEVRRPRRLGLRAPSPTSTGQLARLSEDAGRRLRAQPEGRHGPDLLGDFGNANGVEAPAIVEAVRTGLVTEAEVDRSPCVG